MAKRFGHNPYVIMALTTNMRMCRSTPIPKRSSTMAEGALRNTDKLNGLDNVVWSQTYSEWNQIPIETRYGNPGLLLSWKRFVSDTWRSYQESIDGSVRIAIRGSSSTNTMLVRRLRSLHG
jgi:beta-galactosidase